MDAPWVRTALSLCAVTLAGLLLGPGVAAAVPVTGTSAPGSSSNVDTVPPSPFQGVPSWLLILVGIVVIAFAIRVVAHRGDGNPGRGGGRDRDRRPRRPFRPD